jgi:phosphoglycolate phosphatase-like HAD superfamily hydrolase
MAAFPTPGDSVADLLAAHVAGCLAFGTDPSLSRLTAILTAHGYGPALEQYRARMIAEAPPW